MSSFRAPCWLLPLALAIATATAGCGAAAKSPTAPARQLATATKQPLRVAPGAPRLLGRNARYRIANDISVQLDDVNADVALADPTRPLVLEAKTAYALVVHQATARIDGPSLSALMNARVFNEPDSPIKNMVVTINGDRLTLAAEVKKVFWISFTAEGTLAATPEGLIRFTPTEVRSAGVRVDDLMDLVGLEIARVLETKKEKGVTIHGNDILMDVSAMIPPPRLGGKVGRVRAMSGAVEIGFEDGQAQAWPPMPVPAARNFLAIFGGDVTLGNITVANARAQLVDADPSDPFNFTLDGIGQQLEAGVVTPTRDGHLIGYLPDLRHFGVPMGRYAPPAYPVPGVAAQPK